VVHAEFLRCNSFCRGSADLALLPVRRGMRPSSIAPVVFKDVILGQIT
jgi:hypothetical protein